MAGGVGGQGNRDIRSPQVGFFSSFFFFFFFLFTSKKSLPERLVAVVAAGPDARLAVAGLLISNLAFVGAAVALHALTLRVTKRDDLAAASALLFCFNPASVFHSAVYTESLHALAMFAGMHEISHRRPWRATACFTVAAATRSNAILSIGWGVFLLAREKNHQG